LRTAAPAPSLPDPVRIICRENNLASLLAELALQCVDMVIEDGTVPSGIKVRDYIHVPGECGISFLAVPHLAGRCASTIRKVSTVPRC
jgi:LysR family transcriptional activator of nhaA